MSREIKFRLIRDGKVVGYEWHHDSGTVGIRVFHSTDGEEWWNTQARPSYYIRHDHKDQYTGLKDKNRMEIYEGDIVGLPYDDYYITVVQCKCECGYANILGIWLSEDQYKSEPTNPVYEAQHFRRGVKNSELLYNWLGEPRATVIGNIHENPELLTSNQS